MMCGSVSNFNTNLLRFPLSSLKSRHSCTYPPHSPSRRPSTTHLAGWPYQQQYLQPQQRFVPSPRAFAFQPIYYNYNPYLNYPPTQYQQFQPNEFYPTETTVTEDKPNTVSKKNSFNPKRKQKPNTRAESTTARPAHAPETITVIPEKFVERSQDIRVFNAQQRPDRTFDPKQIFPAPGKQAHSQRFSLPNDSHSDDDVPTVSVSAVTSADYAPNELDLGEGAFTLGNAKGGATLLLQPSAKAISGNGGTSVSAPVSRAVLRKNSGTRVIFRPESVAIAGAGGTAHAQADLILDYVE